MIGEIARQAVGLFVDDGFLAASILAAVAVATALALVSTAPVWLVGLVLTLTLPTALASSVALSVWRARRQNRDG
jgi:hypothetical protein